MRWLTILLSLLWLPAAPVSAQLLHSNAAGVSSGHLHMLVRNPEAHKKIWVESLGAEVVKSGSLELLKLRGIFLVLEKAEPVGGVGRIQRRSLRVPRQGSSCNQSEADRGWSTDYSRG